ncbi:MAG: RsmD family RNA methyltransferase [Flavobacteriaceae bacterium]
MRIISGKHKGRHIKAPKKLPVRPTTDMAKEALFNILNNRYDLGGIQVLDLFAGTGNISYEFASRGTEHITCIDIDHGCIKFISQTSEALEFGITTVKSNVFNYLEKSRIKADIIFADPPYDMSLEELTKINSLVFKNNLLLENGVLIIEHSKQTKLEQLEYFSETRKYGGCNFSFFEVG